MAAGSRPRSGIVWLICASLVGVGCSENPKAEFAWRKSTVDLLPNARAAVEKTVSENFGTPNNLVAWGRMPVNYGGIVGTVVEPPEGVELQPQQVAVRWDGDAASVRPNDPIQWTIGSGVATNAHPTVITAVSENHEILTLAGSAKPEVDDQFSVDFGERLQLGRVVYMKNCMHCHGVAGDGAGPTARYLNPLPRDYREGIFKFTSTHASERATRDDLRRIIQLGVPGTYMPSFLLMDEKEIDAVIEYVRWLAMRGELEKNLGDEMADYSESSIRDEFEKEKNAYEAEKVDGNSDEPAPSLDKLLETANTDLKEYLELDYTDVVDGAADFIADNWTRAEDAESLIQPSVPRVADTAASRANGRLLYLSDKGKCYTCHGNTGRGNGAATNDYWPKPGSTEMYEQRGLHDLWGHVVPPRDLLVGEYRGGRRPVDVYRRIYAGIKGTPMPAFGGTVLTDEEIWDIVNYVMSLPYEADAPAVEPQVAQGTTRSDDKGSR